MLSPNALRVLDALGVWERIRSKGFAFSTLTFKNDRGETTDVFSFGQEKVYGYPGFRIYRQILIDELKAMLEERKVPTKYETKFSHIISESQGKVEFAFTDNSTSASSLLIGADGIHSAVRHYLHPSATPKYLGIAAMTSAIPTSALRLPHDQETPYPLPVAISAKRGAFAIAPQNVDGSEVLIGTQGVFPEQDRAGWAHFRSEIGKDEIVERFRKDLYDWPDVVQSALENVNRDSINLWPFYAVPRLEKWASQENRVIILGDAAHAVPPTTGQGVNQAFEDVYMLSLLLASLSESVTLPKALEFWQQFRQERVDRILDMTRRMNNKRLPAAEQAKLPEGEVWSGTREDVEQLAWLYRPDLRDVVGRWVEGQKSGGEGLQP